MAWIECSIDNLQQILPKQTFDCLRDKRLRIFRQDKYLQIFDLKSYMIYNICCEPYIKIDCNIRAALNVLGIKTMSESKIGRPKVQLDPYEEKRINEMRADGNSINYIARSMRRSNRVIMRYLASVVASASSSSPPAAATQ